MGGAHGGSRSRSSIRSVRRRSPSAASAASEQRRSEPAPGTAKFVWIQLPVAVASEDPEPASAEGWQFGETRILPRLPNLPEDFRVQKYNLQWQKVGNSVASAAAVDSESLRLHVHER